MLSRTISVIFARIFTAEQCQHNNYFELGDTSPLVRTTVEQIHSPTHLGFVIYLA